MVYPKSEKNQIGADCSIIIKGLSGCLKCTSYFYDLNQSDSLKILE
ncbi:hypothetical protein [Alysiella crassa]|nr:hypothetical protein [Alysiella crassa]UOP06879.1 hypothetical protein LVJ80_14495 [Alysiella crassa]